MEATVAKLNPILRGWFGYYRQAERSVHKTMIEWVRGRLRGILRKRHGGKGRGRGWDKIKWPNRYFDDLGLFDLERAREKLLVSVKE